MLNIIGIKTNDGIFITEKENALKEYGNSYLQYYEINGKLPEKTFERNWFKIKSEPKKIQRTINGKKINHRYELRDKSLISDKIPDIFQREDVAFYNGDYWEWKNEYKHLESLYELKYDLEPDSKEDIEFTYVEILKVDELNKPIKLDWECYKSQWTHEGTWNVDVDDLNYRLLDKIAFPKIYYQTNCPVRLPSKIFYRMLRFFIKQNIDNQVAYISSDYDFCFTVKKRIKLLKPIIKTEEVLKANGKPYKNRKFIHKTQQYTGDFTVFEMTSEEHKYKGYPVLPAIEADNLEKLKEKVDLIMNKIIEEINSEVTICPHCNGEGIINCSKNMININELINSQ